MDNTFSTFIKLRKYELKTWLFFLDNPCGNQGVLDRKYQKKFKKIFTINHNQKKKYQPQPQGLFISGRRDKIKPWGRVPWNTLKYITCICPWAPIVYNLTRTSNAFIYIFFFSQKNPSIWLKLMENSWKGKNNKVQNLTWALRASHRTSDAS